MRNYLGLSCSFHDPGLAIVNSAGEVVFAEGTERYQQSKRAIQSPPDDVNRINRLIKKYCEPGAEIVLAQTWSKQYRITPMVQALDAIDAGDIASIPPPVAAALRARGVDIHAPDSDGTRYLINWMRWIVSANILACDASGIHARYRLKEASPQFAGPVVERTYNHHLTHAIVACHSSPFDDAVCAVLDGSGEGTSNAFYHYKDGQVTELRGASVGPGSLGFFYWHLCWACGFDPLAGEEWKVMGLAPYGKLNQDIYNLLRPMMVHEHLRMQYAPDYADRLTALFKLRRPAGSPSLEAADLAFTGQAVFCEWAKLLMDDLYSLGLSKNLVLGGGCALNSSWNGRILDETQFSKLHVFSAPADDGNAIGAAVLAYQEDHPADAARVRLQSPYLGESMSQDTIGSLSTLGGLKNALPPGRSVASYVAELLTQGKIVGWAQGRAEFGPRALGNRSILADPRDPEMKDRINARVKFREEYRPFAPSILHEHGAAYFSNYQASPYMERTLRFHPSAKDKVPAVYHEDGTGRLQTVKARVEPPVSCLDLGVLRPHGDPAPAQYKLQRHGEADHPFGGGRARRVLHEWARCPGPRGPRDPEVTQLTRYASLRGIWWS